MSEMLQDIQVDLFLPDLKATNQKHVLQILAKQIAELTYISAEDLFAQLEEKEKTSTFAIGDGIALPNLQIRGIPYAFKALCTLKKPVDFQAADNHLIDTICLVISPHQEGPLHLRRLARMSRLLKNPDLRRRLRESSTANDMKSALSEPQSTMLAA
jgi:nitrogen PTS system EIIA component